MAQLQLPVFPEGVTQLSNDLGVSCYDRQPIAGKMPTIFDQVKCQEIGFLEFTALLLPTFFSAYFRPNWHRKDFGGLSELLS